MNGTVKFFNNLKRFGFITAEDGKDYFVHQTGLKEAWLCATTIQSLLM